MGTRKENMMSSFVKYRNRFLRYYDLRNSGGGTIFYKVVRKQVAAGILPKEFLEIIEDQAKEKNKLWIRKYRRKVKKLKK